MRELAGLVVAEAELARPGSVCPRQQIQNEIANVKRQSRARIQCLFKDFPRGFFKHGRKSRLKDQQMMRDQQRNYAHRGMSEILTPPAAEQREEFAEK